MGSQQRTTGAVRAPAASWVTPRRAGPVAFVVVGAGYLATTQLVLWLNAPAPGGAGLWPAAGLTLAALLFLPARSWGWVLAAIVVAELGGDLARGHPLGTSLGWTLGNCVEPLVGAVLLRRFGNARGALAPLRQLLLFLLLAVLVAPVVGASIGSATTVISFGAPILEVWPPYFVGDALGVLIVAPALLALRTRPRRRRLAETTALVIVSLLVTAAIFVADGSWWTTSTPYLLIPFFTWAALRFGLHGTAWMSLAITVIANTATAAGYGPFAASGAPGGHAVTLLQTYLAITVASALILAAMVSDLSDREQVERALHHQATHDHLTGLPNRAYLSTALDAALTRCAVVGGRVGVLLCDVDRLKRINDSLGHAAGDLYLAEVARRLGGALRRGEVVARVGGDEFIVLIEDADAGAVDAVARRLMAAVNVPVLLPPNKEVTPSLSIGVALGGADSSSETVISRADHALYEAKKRGRSRIEHFDDRLRSRLDERTQIEEDLQRALGNGDIFCVHQPEIEISTGALFAFETLARWRHPERGLIPPDVFVPVVEATGHADSLFSTVLHRSLAGQNLWAEQLGFRPAVAVNISALQLGDLELVDTVESALARAGASSDTLWLEVTETATADTAALTVLSALHDLGVRLAIDDFGTGWSSMSRLAGHPWDVVKLDRAFIAPLGQEPDAEHLVRAMIVMAHALGMRTVAEGVETPLQLEWLTEMGCDVAQGYLFSRPVSASEAPRLVDANGLWIRSSSSPDRTRPEPVRTPPRRTNRV